MSVVNTPDDNGAPATLIWDLNLSGVAQGFSLEALRVVSYTNTALTLS